MMKKIVLLTFILALILALFSSCGESNKKSAEDILLSITKDLDALPYGNLYLKSAEEGEQEHLNTDAIASLYHEGANEYEFTLIEDFALYLCPKEPCEVAVFKCYSKSDTDLIAAMCLSRIDMLSTALEETPYSDIPKNAKVDIKGRFVTVVMT